ncbi:MAG: recombinase family protein, partial [Ruminococcus sp.]|nr:recombinase family protein [Ruminococcus sp.]
AEQLAELQRLEQFGTAEGVKRMKELADLKDQKKRFRGLYDKHFISEKKYEQQIGEIDLKIERLSREMSRLLGANDGISGEMNTLLEIFEDYEGSDDDKKEIIESAIQKITLVDDKLTFCLQCGLEFTEGV